MCAITFYIGKDDSLGTADVTMTQAVVMRLVDPIKGRGHHVYMDNYYTSPQFFSDLRDNGFGACGTVRHACYVSRLPLLRLSWMVVNAVTARLSIHLMASIELSTWIAFVSPFLTLFHCSWQSTAIYLLVVGRQ